jgi:co-chaperonin GroES (HSP10)
MKNESGIIPLGHAVLIRHYTPERKNSIIEIPDAVNSRDLMVEQRAVVVEVGAHCWPEEPPRAKPGDKVYISRMAGHMVVGVKDGEQYRLVNDRDIFARIEDDADE